jgi:hypothetical protein
VGIRDDILNDLEVKLFVAIHADELHPWVMKPEIIDQVDAAVVL